MAAKKKTLVSKVEGIAIAGVVHPIQHPVADASRSRGNVSMRQVVAKKLAVEKLVTAKRLG